MSMFTDTRLPSEVFRLDASRLPRGWYSDKYFHNITEMLTELAAEGYRFAGEAALPGITASAIETGDIEVEMQWFTRRQPFSVVAGVDEALAILREATGYYDASGQFINTFDQLEVEAVQDGVIIPYSGNPANVLPVLRVRGRYRDFALLETPTLGALTEATRVATNVYQVLSAANGKDVMFFPARFAHYKLQALHGYAYSTAVAAYNAASGSHSRLFVSTDEQGSWWGGSGGGTVAHAAIAAFLGDTAEAMIQFCRLRPVEIPRIALIDFHNDCVGETHKVMAHMFAMYRQFIDDGQVETAEKYRLFGVRPDTSNTLRDRSVAPLGDPRLDFGVNPRLVYTLRSAIDEAYRNWNVPAVWEERAREWCQSVKIIVTGGFTPEKITLFERLKVPVDVYGVGSYLLTNCDHCGTNNDYTADVVRVHLEDRWVDMVKVGRRANDNPLLERID